MKREFKSKIEDLRETQEKEKMKTLLDDLKSDLEDLGTKIEDVGKRVDNLVKEIKPDLKLQHDAG